MSPVRELYINFHLGITRVAVWFKKQFTIKHYDAFTFNKIYVPTIETIVGKGDEWIKAISSFSESNKMAIQIKEHPRTQATRTKKRTRREAIGERTTEKGERTTKRIDRFAEQ